jgi:hypothetical protein
MADFSKNYQRNDIEKSRWAVNYYEAMMPFGAVFFALLLFSLLAYCLRGRYYSMRTAFLYVQFNVFCRYMINFFLPILYYTVATIRDKDVSYDLVMVLDQRALLQWRVAAGLRYCDGLSPSGLLHLDPVDVRAVKA